LFFGVLCSCKNELNPKATVTETIDVTVFDPHSYANLHEVQTNHLSLELEVSFENQTIYGIARHKIINNNAHKAIFDINGPLIQKVTTGPKGKEVEADFVIGKMDEDSVLGQPLIVTIAPTTKYVNIYYKTGDRCNAVEWIQPKSKKEAFLYTQGQAILTRTWIPLQDAPSNRITYDATVKVNPSLLALMSAENPTTLNLKGEYHFKMEHPIPSYLIALTVGNIRYHGYTNRCGVYAPVDLLSKAQQEFSDLPEMIEAIEKLYGPYAWGKYDVMVQHPSFPFGGMENPRLTFVNPAIVAGDKSLVSVIAHELAHSWSGNLVTNETWNDFWLNEGFTVYLEHRIMEELYGKTYSEMLSEIEWAELQQELKTIQSSEHPEDAALLLQLKNRDPDDGMTSVAYVKGAYFLKTLEHTIGRKKMDQFLNEYFNQHRFQSMNTEKFIAFMKNQLAQTQFSNFDYQRWIFQPGVPANVVLTPSVLFSEMKTMAKATNEGKDIFAPVKKVKWVHKKGSRKKRKKIFVEQLNPRAYNTQQWIMYFRSLNSRISAQKLQKMDEFAHFSEANSEVRFEWFLLNLRCGNWIIATSLKEFLASNGRRKYVLTLFNSILRDKNRLEWAREVYQSSKGNYHSVTRNSVEKLLY
jgi:aminopeptidase N